MRELTVKQKKALKGRVIQYYSKYGCFPVALDEIDGLNEIDNMNPCALFWSNADRFVDDLRWSKDFDYMFRR
jgi:hypothetical protein